MAGFMEGKRALIVGVANRNSIAWGIAERLLHHGLTEIAFSYQSRFEKNIRELIAGMPNAVLVEADVTVPETLDSAFAELDRRWGGIDAVVHCVAAARTSELEGAFVDTSRDGFLFAQEVSSYSLVELARRAAPLMEKRGGGSVLCLTYLGGERVVPNYNVMGVAKASLEMAMRYLANDLGPKNIRVNALSAGPMRTISSRGIAQLSDMFRAVEERSPMRRNVTLEEVGDAGVFLLSDLSRAVTGEVLYVDNGYHIMGF
jgi:enoyl-[acyl-carrier protein] reductase I